MGFGLGQLYAQSHLAPYFSFKRVLVDPERTQLQILKRHALAFNGSALFKKKNFPNFESYTEFANKIPLTTYEDWGGVIDLSRAEQKTLTHSELFPHLKRFEPTSGSTSKRKWIPYTKSYLSEVGRAASVWLYDLHRQHPGFFSGPHFWSLSWLPDDLRQELKDTDDLKTLSLFKQWALSKVMAVPNQVSGLDTNEQCRKATLAYLAATADLRVLSFWSPTFALQLFEDMAEHRLELSEILASGRWNDLKIKGIAAPRSKHQSASLKNWNGTLEPSFFRALWPKLLVVSSWESSTSWIWAQKLKELLSHAHFQAKGLWATEGVVTIPFEGASTLAVTSHFYEFKCLESGAILPSWNLREGQSVQPILTLGNGLTRYQLSDQLRVTGFLAKTPRLEFIGRLDGVDLVGEKLSSAFVSEVLNETAQEFGVRCVCLVSQLQPKPHYVLLVESSSASEFLAKRLEGRLSEMHHYRLARELGQLGEVKVHASPLALKLYDKLTDNLIEGSRKIEPLLFTQRSLHEI